MTRTYAAHQLLKLGPLTFPELREITGWSKKALDCTIFELRKRGRISVSGTRRKQTYSAYSWPEQPHRSAH